MVSAYLASDLILARGALHYAWRCSGCELSWRSQSVPSGCPHCSHPALPHTGRVDDFTAKDGERKAA